MDSIRVQGGIALQGKVCIQGSKNASLPVLAAALLVGERSFIRNCPRIADVYAMVSLLKSLGCRVQWHKTGIAVDSSRVRKGEMPMIAAASLPPIPCRLQSSHCSLVRLPVSVRTRGVYLSLSGIVPDMFTSSFPLFGEGMPHGCQCTGSDTANWSVRRLLGMRLSDT